MDAWFSSACAQHVLHYFTEVNFDSPWHEIRLRAGCNPFKSRRGSRTSQSNGDGSLAGHDCRDQLHREAHIQNMFLGLLANYGEDYVHNRIGAFRGCRLGSLCERCVDDVHDVWLRGMQQIGRTAGCVDGGSFATFLAMVIYTWNSAGLFCNDVFKYKAKLRFIEAMFTNGTVIGFQETHDDGDTASNHLRQLYSNSFIFKYLFCIWGCNDCPSSVVRQHV